RKGNCGQTRVGAVHRNTGAKSISMRFSAGRGRDRTGPGTLPAGNSSSRWIEGQPISDRLGPGVAGGGSGKGIERSRIPVDWKEPFPEKHAAQVTWGFRRARESRR